MILVVGAEGRTLVVADHAKPNRARTAEATTFPEDPRTTRRERSTGRSTTTSRTTRGAVPRRNCLYSPASLADRCRGPANRRHILAGPVRSGFARRAHP